MDTIIYKAKLPKKNFYYFATKYAVLLGFLIFTIAIFFAIFENIQKGIPWEGLLVFPLIFSPLFILGQIVFSWICPHQVLVLKDRIIGYGPWNVKHTLKYNTVARVLYNHNEILVTQQLGANKMHISKSVDPDLSLLNVLREIIEVEYKVKFIETQA